MLESFVKMLVGPCKVREGQSVLACCSGGVDSMVLLDLLRQAALLLRLNVGVVHVDHGIRQEASTGDARFVSEHCRKLGFSFHLYRLGMSSHEPNLEEQARIRRYDSILACMAEHGYEAAATGHSKDDQAETLLYRLSRGSGIRGLSAMEHRLRNNIIRPMLDFTREQIERYAADHGVPYVEDCTNLDTKLARNLIRHEVIPAMKKINPSVVSALSRLAQIAREEGDCIEDLSIDLERATCVLNWGIVRAYRLAGLAHTPKAVLKRMVIRVLSFMLNEPRGIDALQVQAVMDVIEGRKSAHTIKRCATVSIDDECLVFSCAGAGPHYDIPVPGPGVYFLEPLLAHVWIDFEGSLDAPLRLASPTQGGRCGGKRVVKLLADRKIMKSIRHFWPVLLSNTEIISVAGVFDSIPSLKTEFPFTI